VSKNISIKLSPYSIEKAVKSLKDYEKKRLNAETIANRLLDALVNESAGIFGGMVHITRNRVSDTVWEVEFSTGVEHLITFLEFGTGTETLDNPEYASELPINIYAGSWSEDKGKGTYQEWVQTGGITINNEWRPYAKYPYNHTPKMGIFYGMEAARKELERIARGR